MALAIDNSRLLDETQRAVQLRDQFLWTASHELRTPLTSLRLTVESLLHGAGRQCSRCRPRRSRTALRRVLHNTDRLRAPGHELLDVTRIEQGQPTLAPAEIALDAIVREAVEHFEFDLAAAGSSASIDCAAPGHRAWDPTRLEQVVTNLLRTRPSSGQVSRSRSGP